MDGWFGLKLQGAIPFPFLDVMPKIGAKLPLFLAPPVFWLPRSIAIREGSIK